MKKLKIDHDLFVKSVNLLDRAVGSVEPINRRVYFYAKFNTLMAYASDGCLSVNISLGKIEHFDDFYVVPLDNLKLLSKSGDEDVEIRFGSKLEFLKGPEYVAVLHPLSRDPRKRGSFVARWETKSSEFSKTMDRGSITLREGQDVIVGITEDEFFALSEEYSHAVIAFMKMPGTSFISSIPYESVRHLVKSLDILGDEKIKIGYREEFIGLKFAQGIMTLCKSPAENVSLDKIQEFLEVRKIKGFSVETKLLKEGAAFSAKFQRKNGGRGYIEFSDKIRIGVTSQYSAYEYSKPSDIRLNVRMPIIPKKLNQFLSRINEKHVKIALYKDTLFFVGKNSLFAVKNRSLSA